MMARVLTRSQLARVTRGVRTHHHHHHHHPSSSSSSVSSTRWIPFSTARVRPFSRNKRELPESVVQLNCSSSSKSGVCNVYLVGTFHQSRRSCEEVRTVIKLLKPEAVFLQLCSKRLGLAASKPQKVASKVKAIPTNEFRVACEEAMKYGGKVVLGGRPIEITLMRAGRKVPFLEVIKLFSLPFRKDRSSLAKALLSFTKDCLSSIEALRELMVDDDMSDIDMATSYQELGKICPTLVETFVHEEDLYMSARLLEVAKKSSCVVAVVGNGHLLGMKNHWQQPVSVQDLLTVPPKRSAKMLTSIGVVMVGVAMIWRYL